MSTQRTDEVEGLDDLIRDVLEMPDLVVHDKLGLGVIEEWDSFNQVNLMIAIESQYGVEFEPEEMGNLRTVEAIRCALRHRLPD